jgi:uncharacterized membrane protein
MPPIDPHPGAVPPLPSLPPTEPHSSLVTLSHVTYLLHGIGLGLGAFAAATVFGIFAFGWSSILAVVLNYLKRDDVRGTWLESHFTWQIRTFWAAMVAAVVVGLAGVGLVIGAITTSAAGGDASPMSLGFVAWGLAWLLLGAWVLYRVVRGWTALGGRRPIT